IPPTQGMELEFGQVALGKSVTTRLFFRGENLKGSFDLVVIGADNSQFSIPSNTIAASLVNAPTAIGSMLHTLPPKSAHTKHA
ncbi:MAG: hypothetical protein K2I19_05910, partial [Muribaculaceae bacterium]|nr:hypothetical protein [Muribaculaceae bacterium]